MDSIKTKTSKHLFLLPDPTELEKFRKAMKVIDDSFNSQKKKTPSKPTLQSKPNLKIVGTKSRRVGNRTTSKLILSDREIEKIVQVFRKGRTHRERPEPSDGEFNQALDWFNGAKLAQTTSASAKLAMEVLGMICAGHVLIDFNNGQPAFKLTKEGQQVADAITAGI